MHIVVYHVCTIAICKFSIVKVSQPFSAAILPQPLLLSHFREQKSHHYLCWMVGADCARPSSDLNPILDMCFSMVSLRMCFVSISAGLSTPNTLVSLKSPFLSRSCIQRSAVCKCRILPRPRRRHMPIAAVASVKTSNSKSIDKSRASDC